MLHGWAFIAAIGLLTHGRIFVAIGPLLHRRAIIAPIRWLLLTLCIAIRRLLLRLPIAIRPLLHAGIGLAAITLLRRTAIIAVAVYSLLAGTPLIASIGPLLRRAGALAVAVRALLNRWSSVVAVRPLLRPWFAVGAIGALLRRRIFTLHSRRQGGASVVALRLLRFVGQAPADIHPRSDTRPVGSIGVLRVGRRRTEQQAGHSESNQTRFHGPQSFYRPAKRRLPISIRVRLLPCFCTS
ncbi:MAG: hypothetical protein NTV56_23480 [Alphaproteobacteria bacterium]|nr:hypothetical protein [Alphaproteobacteria bacterium]